MINGSNSVNTWCWRRHIARSLYMCVCVYIYIERERERKRQIYKYIERNVYYIRTHIQFICFLAQAESAEPPGFSGAGWERRVSAMLIIIIISSSSMHVYIYIYTQRGRERHIDIQTYRHIDIYTYTHIDIQICIYSGVQQVVFFFVSKMPLSFLEPPSPLDSQTLFFRVGGVISAL